MEQAKTPASRARFRSVGCETPDSHCATASRVTLHRAASQACERSPRRALIFAPSTPST
jgi:hypothetical protein